MPLGAATTTVDDLRAADTVARVVSPSALDDDRLARVGAAGDPAAEIVRVDQLTTTSDIDACYLIGPVGRQRTVRLRVQPDNVTVDHVVNVDQSVNDLDLPV